jgi:O-antigen/teichoic acid export membrane protein
MASPKTILYIIGKQYLQGESILLVLSFGILPFSIVENAISKFNYLGQLRKLLSIGFTQLLVFIITFLLLVPYYGSLGAAFSVVISFIASAALSIYWLERQLIKYIANSCIAIAAGWSSAAIFTSFFSSSSSSSSSNTGSSSIIIYQLVAVLISITVALTITIGLKNTSIAEIKRLVRTTISSNTD